MRTPANTGWPPLIVMTAFDFTDIFKYNIRMKTETKNAWFTSDLHFDHNRIIQLAPKHRTFGTVDDMNTALINAINVTVPAEDVLYILGDVSFGKPSDALTYLDSINCHKVLIVGNHDSIITNNAALRSKFDEIHPLLERHFKVGDSKHTIVMCHYAMKAWRNAQYGSIHLYGHSHGNMPDDGSRSMDVGVDAIGMTPISVADVVARMTARPVTQLPDHHMSK